MPKGVTINFSLGRVAKRAPKIVADAINDIADLQVNSIVFGFSSGKDVNDKKYTPSRVDGRAINLIGESGDMLRGAHISKRATATKPIATITSGKKSAAYAQVHNEGLKSGRKGATFTMPKREWFPSDKILKRAQKEVDGVIKRSKDKIIAAVKGK